MQKELMMFIDQAYDYISVTVYMNIMNIAIMTIMKNLES